MEQKRPYGQLTSDSLRRGSWTTLYHEENPLHRFGLNTSRSCAASQQFRLNLVRDSEKSALGRFRYDAEADATAWNQGTVIRWR